MIPRIPRFLRCSILDHYHGQLIHWAICREEEWIRDGRKDWFVLALCRSSMGIRILSVLSNLIVRNQARTTIINIK
jgi:hypothetical protein